jgi:hypothetical protein
VGCPWGGAHIFGIEARLDDATCSAIPLSQEQRERQYEAMRHVDEIKNVMEAVAARLVALAEDRAASNALPFGR